MAKCRSPPWCTGEASQGCQPPKRATRRHLTAFPGSLGCHRGSGSHLVKTGILLRGTEVRIAECQSKRIGRCRSQSHPWAVARRTANVRPMHRLIIHGCVVGAIAQQSTSYSPRYVKAPVSLVYTPLTCPSGLFGKHVIRSCVTSTAKTG